MSTPATSFDLGSDSGGLDLSDWGSSGSGSSFDLSSVGTDLSGSESPISLDPSFSTTTANPSLSASLSAGISTPAALNTVNPNLATYSSGSKVITSDLTSLSSSISQWGYNIAGILGGGSSQPSSMPTTSYKSTATTSNGKLLIFGLVGIAILVLLNE